MLIEGLLEAGGKRVRSRTLHAYAGTKRVYIRCIMTAGHPSTKLVWERVTGHSELRARVKTHGTKRGPAVRVVFRPLNKFHGGLWRCRALLNGVETNSLEARLFVHCKLSVMPFL